MQHTPRPNDRLAAKIIPVNKFDIAVFGGTGDLSLRKLMPSLYHRFKDKQMPEGSRILGVSRSKKRREAFVKLVRDHILKYVEEKYIDKEILDQFVSCLDYVALDAGDPETWDDLKAWFNGPNNDTRVFYLSVSPGLFGPICRHLNTHQLITDQTRVVLEKPVGHDLESACAINDEVGQYFREDQIYRIDHYLGKETVQNLMALRFANSLFEPIWNREHVDHVQITVAESIGIGTRGYYDTAGALRDMVQNHMLQLLCLVGMEPPKEFEADAVRDEKLKVLRALRPMEQQDLKTGLVMGQYRKGAVASEPVKGYLEEDNVAENSYTETYVALKAEIDNWRWAGVPFYLRTGKRMPMRTSEIVIHFKEVPHLIFPGNKDQVRANRLVIRLQPDEGIRLYLMTKVPGPGGFRMQVAPLNLSFAETFKMRYPDGYERLVMDVVRGNPTLFMRRDEVEAAWIWAERILKAWDNLGDAPQPYTAGTWGPTAAIALIERDGRTWYEYGA